MNEQWSKEFQAIQDEAALRQAESDARMQDEQLPGWFRKPLNVLVIYPVVILTALGAAILILGAVVWVIILLAGLLGLA